jgi:hypothetical protein
LDKTIVRARPEAGRIDTICRDKMICLSMSDPYINIKAKTGKVSFPKGSGAGIGMNGASVGVSIFREGGEDGEDGREGRRRSVRKGKRGSGRSQGGSVWRRKKAEPGQLVT